MAATWDSNFEASPDGDDNPGQGDDKIREFKLEVRKRIGNEHGNYVNSAGGATGAQGTDWVHKKGSARAYYQSDAPTLRPDGQTSIGTNDAGRLWVSNGATHITKVWTGSAWSLAALGVTDQNSGNPVMCTVLTSGQWNMSNTTSLIVQHTLSVGKIRGWNTVVRKDGTLACFDLYYRYGYPGSQSGFCYFFSDVMVLCKIAGGAFGGGSFNSTGFDRALTTVWYEI